MKVIYTITLSSLRLPISSRPLLLLPPSLYSALLSFSSVSNFLRFSSFFFPFVFFLALSSESSVFLTRQVACWRSGVDQHYRSTTLPRRRIAISESKVSSSVAEKLPHSQRHKLKNVKQY